MDIQHLVDRLEDLIDDGKHIFGTRFTMVDEERALEIIDQMRISIPEEIEKAARILAERERVLAQAHEDAARIVQQAHDKGELLLDREATVQAAQQRAEVVLEKAREDARNMTTEADQYVIQVLARLEQQLIKNLNVIRNGITEVNNRATGQLGSIPAAMPAQQMPQSIEQPEPVEAEMATDRKKK